MAPKVKYVINLNTVFNRAFSDKSAEVRTKARAKLSDASFKRAYGLAVIKSIEERTSKQHINKNNKSMGTYTKAYASSLFGQVYGKRAGGRVTLKASGEMLAGMRSVDTPRTIVIDFPSQLQNDKAHGHINYRDPKRAPNGRDFFGLPPKEEDNIMRNVMRQSSQETLINAASDVISESVLGLQGGQTSTTLGLADIDLDSLLEALALGQF